MGETLLPLRWLLQDWQRYVRAKLQLSSSSSSPPSSVRAECNRLQTTYHAFGFSLWEMSCRGTTHAAGGGGVSEGSPSHVRKMLLNVQALLSEPVMLKAFSAFANHVPSLMAVEEVTERSLLGRSAACWELLVIVANCR